MIRDDTIYLRHIQDAINRIEVYVNGLDHKGFIHSSLVQDGVIRQFEIIGEATKNLTSTFKEGYPEIPCFRQFLEIISSCFKSWHYSVPFRYFQLLVLCLSSNCYIGIKL